MVRVILNLLLLLPIILLLVLRLAPLESDDLISSAADPQDSYYQQQIVACLEQITRAQLADDTELETRLRQAYRPILSGWQDHVRRSARRGWATADRNDNLFHDDRVFCER